MSEVHVPLTTVTILVTTANLSPITGGDCGGSENDYEDCGRSERA